MRLEEAERLIGRFMYPYNLSLLPLPRQHKRASRTQRYLCVHGSGVRIHTHVIIIVTKTYQPYDPEYMMRTSRQPKNLASGHLKLGFCRPARALQNVRCLSSRNASLSEHYEYQTRLVDIDTKLVLAT